MMRADEQVFVKGVEVEETIQEIYRRIEIELQQQRRVLEDVEQRIAQFPIRLSPSSPSDETRKERSLC